MTSVAEPTDRIEAIIWRIHDVGGRATFMYADGTVSTQWLSREDAESLADDVFSEGCQHSFFDGGCRWTRTIRVPS